LINFQAADTDQKDIVEVTVTAKEASNKKLLEYLVKNNLMITKTRMINFKYTNENHPELNGKKLSLSFTASDGKVLIQKDLDLVFEKV
jgi:hypothetical protein